MLADRLRQARLRAGLSLDELVAELESHGTQITKASLSKYELGKSMPRPALMLAIAQALGVKPAFLLEEPKFEIEWFAFRKGSLLSASQQARIKAEAAHIASAHISLSQTLHHDQPPALPPRRVVSSVEQIEDAADELRDAWKLGRAPIESVTGSAEDNGAVVVGLDGVPRAFDGLSGCALGNIPVAILRARVPDDRWRFNLAHEFGHLLLDVRSQMVGKEEQAAHRFAGAFLAPRDAVARDLGSPRRHLSMAELGLLKQKYGMSMQAWARRALDVGAIRQSYYRYLCTRFSANGWREVEPVAFQGFELPTRLRQMSLQAFSEGIISEERATELSPEMRRDVVPEMPVQGSLAHRLRSGALSARDIDSQLRRVAESAAVEYKTNPQLKGFDAFCDGDFFDQPITG